MSESALNTVLLALHEGCRRCKVDAFKHWALELATTLVPFDTAHWSNAVIVDDRVHIFNSCALGMDIGFAERLEKHVHLDTRMQENYANP